MDLTPDAQGTDPSSTDPPGQGRPASLLDERQWSLLQSRYELTPREVQIADLVCRGLRNSRVAEFLHIQPATVQAHVRNIYRKIKVRGKINMLLKFVNETK